MDLFWVEHKKLWSRGSVKISVLLCIIYIVVFSGPAATSMAMSIFENGRNMPKDMNRY